MFTIHLYFSEDKMKDINSPDSNDSGIQADVHHIQAPGSNDVYAVVNKPSRKPPTAAPQPAPELPVPEQPKKQVEADSLQEV